MGYHSAVTYRVDDVDVLVALLLLASDPVTVEVCKEAVDKVCTRSVPVPLCYVVSEQSLVGETLGALCARAS